MHRISIIEFCLQFKQTLECTSVYHLIISLSYSFPFGKGDPMKVVHFRLGFLADLLVQKYLLNYRNKRKERHGPNCE